MSRSPRVDRVMIVIAAVLLPVLLSLVTFVITAVAERAPAGITPDAPKVGATASPTDDHAGQGGDGTASPTPSPSDDHGGSSSGTGSTPDDHGGSSGGSGTPSPTASDDQGGGSGPGDDGGHHAGGDD